MTLATAHEAVVLLVQTNTHSEDPEMHSNVALVTAHSKCSVYQIYENDLYH